MKRYIIAYGAWLMGVFACAAVMLAWYKHVQEIGWRELANIALAREAQAPDDVDAE